MVPIPSLIIVTVLQLLNPFGSIEQLLVKLTYVIYSKLLPNVEYFVARVKPRADYNLK